MVQEHIHKLLYSHDCVIIPDFGGLITHYEPARIHPVKHTFLPPSKRVAFNEKLKLNDGLLISTFAYDKHISTEEAQNQVAAFVRNLQEVLHHNQRYELKGIGVFWRNATQKLEFDYMPADNMLDEKLGLPELMARPILVPDAAAGLRTLLKEKQKEQERSTTKPTFRRKIQRLYNTAAVFAIVGLSMSALYFISLQTDYNINSLNTAAFFNNEPNTSRKIDKAAAKPVTVITEAPVSQPALNSVEETPVTAAPEPEVPSNNIVTPVAVIAAKPENNKTVVIISAAKAFAKPVTKPVAAVAKKENAVKSVIPEKNIAGTINTGSGRFYVIAGGYNSLKNAVYLQNILKKGGKPSSKVIMPYPGSKLHRVSIIDYTSRDEAIQQLPALKQKYGKNIWLLNY